MLALLLASIIANGYIILRFAPSHFYKLHRFDGQLLYIKATFIGVLTISFTFLIDSYFGIVGHLMQALPKNVLGTVFKAEHLQECIVFFLSSVSLSILYCILEKLRWYFRAFWLFSGIKNKPSYSELGKILLMGTILDDSPLDKLLFLSYVRNIFLLITMVDRKVYVGRVISLGEPNENQGPDQEISIVPVFSGFRERDSMRVNLNTSYNNSNEEDTKDVYLILKQENIVSACEFVESLYEKLSRDEMNLQ